jgi:Family of unknown function (DUF6001)
MTGWESELETLLGYPAESLRQRRVEACRAFLSSRGTSIERLRSVVTDQMEHVEHVLMTSSPVHGLANSTSDIDTICVVDTSEIGERTATQIFDAGNHYEMMAFTGAEVATAIQRLEEAAKLPVAGQIAAFKTWDGQGPLKRKYIERLINGVSIDGGLPYVQALPALARFWRSASLGRLLFASGCAVLAERAGETRAALGYCLNALLYAMDAMLSHHGIVYSNKKWFLLRWRRFRASGPVRMDVRELDQALSEAWSEALRAFGGSAPPGLTQRVIDIASMADRAFGAALCPGARWEAVPGTQRAPFIPGAHAVLKGDVFFLAGSDSTELPVSWSDRSVSAADASAALRMVRAGFAKLSFPAPEGLS